MNGHDVPVLDIAPWSLFHSKRTEEDSEKVRATDLPMFWRGWLCDCKGDAGDGRDGSRNPLLREKGNKNLHRDQMDDEIMRRRHPLQDPKDKAYEKGKLAHDNSIMANHSVNDTANGPSQPVQLRLSDPRRIFVGTTGLCIAMALPQSAEKTTTPQVIEVTLEQFRAFLERRQEQAALHTADASEANEVATISSWVGPIPRLSIVCTYEQWWQLQDDFPGECLWSMPE
ncbi:hypothetical protein E4U39_004403 [Claviceps sp. Clav50 group G5]|nr:hypothetical protein E4U39_004403 [Claviceps sp. Clav50 group G5]